MKYQFSTIVLAIAVSVFSTLMVHTLLTPTTPAFVTVDVKSTLDAYHQELIKKEISLEEQTERLVQFSEVMHEEIALYNEKHNAIALVSAAVVGGAVDVTPKIQKAIIQRYTEEESP
ncbi:hypothetical protein AKJ18_22100 [Vibrio xuii]|nr:hypothetical protein AKJ18_22100 [Vibrio xuii]